MFPRHVVLHNCSNMSIKVTLQIETKSDKQLFLAASSGDYDTLQRVLDSGRVHVDCKNEDGTTPLMIGSAKGYKKCVALLLEEGADPCERRNSGTHSLFFAAQSGHLDIVVALVQNQPNCIHIKGQDGGTAVFVACQFGHFRIVEYLYQSGADINLQMKDGASPIFIASQNNHVDIVQYLISVGAKVNLDRNDGAGPLWIASQMGNAQVVKLLLASGAEPDKAREDGATPLFKAAHKGYIDVVEELLNRKCNTGLSANGESPLHAAALFGHMAVVSRLIQAGCSPSLKNSVTTATNPSTTLIVDTIKPTRIYKSGEVAADLARQTGHFDVADFLSNTRLRR